MSYLLSGRAGDQCKVPTQHYLSSFKTGMLEGSFNDAVELAVFIALPNAEVNRVELSTEVDIKLQNNHYLFDYGVFTHVIVTLLNNAVKFSRPRSVVSVDCFVDDEEPDDAVVNVTVRDQGCGFSKDLIEKLFVPQEAHAKELSSLILPRLLNIKYCSMLLSQNGAGKLTVSSKRDTGTKVNFLLKTRVI